MTRQAYTFILTHATANKLAGHNVDMRCSKCGMYFRVGQKIVARYTGTRMKRYHDECLVYIGD